MRKIVSLYCTGLAAFFLVVPAEAGDGRRAVHYGGTTEFDACSYSGNVGNLDTNGENFLSVRAGPSSNATELDHLKTGQGVTICEEQGRWMGIIYGAEDQDCGGNSPVAKRQAYRGPCKSGWVSTKYIVNLAG